jgi:hypothetical protein
MATLKRMVEPKGRGTAIIPFGHRHTHVYPSFSRETPSATSPSITVAFHSSGPLQRP